MFRPGPPFSAHVALYAAVISLIGGGAAACAPAVLSPVDPQHDLAVEALGPEDPKVPVGPLHRAGQPCMLCHDVGQEAPIFNIAGTLYRDNVTATPLTDADVVLVDAAAHQFTAHTNCVGNFYVGATQFEPVWPFWVTIRQSGIDSAMGSPIHRERSCAACHFNPAGPRTSGQVYLTSDDFFVPMISRSGLSARRRKTLNVRAARLAFALAVVGSVAACVGQIGDDGTGAGVRRELLSPPRANFERVADALQPHCGTLDCHGEAGRNLRLFGGRGLRLQAGADPLAGDTTPAEYDATFWSVVALEPETMTAVLVDKGANPERLSLIRKARGHERHKGGTLMNAGDSLDQCLLSWLAGAVVEAPCRAAAMFDAPGRTP